MEQRKHTKFEMARLIGSRALQISMGAPFLVKLSEKDLEKIGFNPIEIAKLEYKEDLLPISIRKPASKKHTVNDKKAATA